MAAAILVCLQLYVPRFQHLQNLFIKIINKKAYKFFSTTDCSFLKPVPVSTNVCQFSGCHLTSLDIFLFCVFFSLGFGCYQQCC